MKLLEQHIEECSRAVEKGIESQETLDFFLSLRQDLASASEADFEAMSELWDQFPSENEDHIQVILKGHLLIDKMTRKFISIKLINSQALEHMRLTSDHCIQIAESMYLRNDEPRWLWNRVRDINEIRNTLDRIHKQADLETKISTFVSEVSRNRGLSDESLGNAIARIYGMIRGLCELGASEEFRISSSMEDLIKIFDTDKKKDLVKHCKNITIYKSDIVDMIIACEMGITPYLHRIHHADYLPDHLMPTDEEIAASMASKPGPVSGKAEKFIKKTAQTFKERRYLVGHMFYKADLLRWNFFYFDQRDLDHRNAHWKEGQHIHLINYLWPNYEPNKLWSEFCSGNMKIKDSIHVKYFDEIRRQALALLVKIDQT
jgi:hypothetical protein